MIQNQQLFSEAYLREIRHKAHAPEAVSACRQTVKEWREEYDDLRDARALTSYTGQVLSALGVAYAPLPSGQGFRLFGDSGRGTVTGLCLLVADDDLGRTTKGRHHQANLVRQLREEKLQWGVVTNGSQWRLCHAVASAPYEVFVQADLDGLAHSDDLAAFGTFFHLFGKYAFATVENSTVARTGLDQFLAASERRTEAIERHLKGRVESLLQTLCLGFVKDEAAGEYSREKLDAIYKNSIYLLYRLLFLFYAEARNLLPTELPAYAAVSLASLVRDARRAQQTGTPPDDPHLFWRRLRNLFAIVDYGDSSVDVAAYNGGLFSDEEKPYLRDHDIANDFLAPALFALGYEETKGGVEAIDYRDLSVRHLGTLYEGLLEYRLNLVRREPIVVREAGGKRQFLPESLAQPVKKGETVLPVGQVYFADDKGERKSSGSYYTPEDVVQYIVGNTVTPKLVERRAGLDAELEELRREYEISPTDEARARVADYADGRILVTVMDGLLSLRVLDPTMGSGHFLVAAGQEMTNFIVETLNATPWANDAISTDPLLWKRRVVERCLYGVDKNDLAQELAKLSLWISSASASKPLTFLDHHLKCGNSLYGAPLRRLSTLPTSKSTQSNNLFGELSETVLSELTAQVGKITGVDSDHIADVKEKGEQNRRAHELTCRLSDIANVWLASLFDLKGDGGKALTDDHYAYLLNLATQNRTSESWENLVRGNRILSDARAISAKKEFFHWELEFPESVVDGECRFDAVVANPPYVGTKPDKAITAMYETAKCGDLYAWVMEKALCMTTRQGSVGTIVPLSFMFSRQFNTLRSAVIERGGHSRFANFDASRDGIFLPNGESRNGQRATIALLHGGSELRFQSTRMVRWIGTERPALLPSLTYSDVTHLVTTDNFPKVGDTALSSFYERLQAYPRKVGDAVYVPPKSKNGTPTPNEPTLYHAFVPDAVRYFITAMPFAFKRSKLNGFPFTDEWTRDVALLGINSNVFYWLWCVIGDGFDVPASNVLAMVCLDIAVGDPTTSRLRDKLMAATDECATYHSQGGERIPNFNFNKRMDILLEIDDWIVRYVAPDLNLPRDIFAQYKSNSFLRPLDLSAITGATADMEGEE